MNNYHTLSFWDKLKCSKGMLFFYLAVMVLYVLACIMRLMPIPEPQATGMWVFCVTAVLMFILPLVYFIYTGIYIYAAKKRYIVVYAIVANVVSLIGSAIWTVVSILVYQTDIMAVWKMAGVANGDNLFIVCVAPLLLQWICTFILWELPSKEKVWINEDTPENMVIGISTYGTGKKKD